MLVISIKKFYEFLQRTRKVMPALTENYLVNLRREELHSIKVLLFLKILYEREKIFLIIQITSHKLFNCLKKLLTIIECNAFSTIFTANKLFPNGLFSFCFSLLPFKCEQESVQCKQLLNSFKSDIIWWLLFVTPTEPKPNDGNNLMTWYQIWLTFILRVNLLK